MPHTTEAIVSPAAPTKSLKKQLGLVDVFAICTGAMFGSGFFLLPGIAAAQTGSSVVLAYIFAAVLALPALLNVAELSTAMPKAGGAYFFLERALGPLMGTVGGLGTWLALVLKSAFALLGMGAYLAILVDVPIKPLAVALTVVFAFVNVAGAKESAGFQRILVYTLIGILTYFIAEAGFTVLAVQDADTTWSNMGPFLPGGLDGFFATVGLVFVSYAGLTKVASVAEEVQNPDRNIPLGMVLSLVVATIIYGIGVFLLNAIVPPEVFHKDLAPVATAVPLSFNLMSKDVGLTLIVVAAFAAFASTANAGVMASSRYPYAMARDSLVPDAFGKLNRFGTPTLGIIATAVLMIFFIVFFDITAVAKLASAFQLTLFALLSLAVIVMRESRIPYYQPGFKSPLYPWVQIAGILIPLGLIGMMGALAITFTAIMIAACIGWYFAYGRKRVTDRTGAIYHVFERLGQQVHRGLDQELRSIVAERGAMDSDPFEPLVNEALVVDVEGPCDFEDVARMCAEKVAQAYGLDAKALLGRILAEQNAALIPVVGGTALPHLALDGPLEHPLLVLARVTAGVDVASTDTGEPHRVQAVLLLLSPDKDTATTLHLLAQLASRAEDLDFMPEWLHDESDEQLRRTVHGHLRYHRIEVGEGGNESLVGASIDDVVLPAGAMVALVWRDGRDFVPRHTQGLREGDRLTVIGDREVIRQLREGEAA